MWTSQKVTDGVWAITGGHADRKFVFDTNNEEDADWLARTLNIATDTMVRLACNNQQCAGKGGFITRTTEEAQRTAYVCDVCGQRMAREKVLAPPVPKAAEPEDLRKTLSELFPSGTPAKTINSGPSLVDVNANINSRLDGLEQAYDMASQKLGDLYVLKGQLELLDKRIQVLEEHMRHRQGE